jgi:hypothetical protein
LKDVEVVTERAGRGAAYEWQWFRALPGPPPPSWPSTFRLAGRSRSSTCGSRELLRRYRLLLPAVSVILVSMLAMFTDPWRPAQWHSWITGPQ